MERAYASRKQSVRFGGIKQAESRREARRGEARQDNLEGMYVDRTWRGDSTQTGSGVIFCGHEEKRQGKTKESGLIKTVHRRLQRGRTIGCEGRSQFESRALLTAWSKVEQIGTIGNSIQYGRNFMAPSFRRNRPDRGRGRPVVLPFARMMVSHAMLRQLLAMDASIINIHFQLVSATF